MPIDFQQIYTRIKEIAAEASERKRALEERRIEALRLLSLFDSDLDFLRSRVEAAKVIDPNIHCAAPFKESLASYFPLPASGIDATVIVADGSQVNPDRHAAIQFCLINVGAIIMKLSSGKAPDVSIESELLYGDDLLPNGSLMTDGMVALMRDLRERMKLDELSKNIDGQVVTLTDGPIELWGAKGDDPQAYANFVDKYLGVLSRLQSRGVITAGYVEKPGADLVVRLLEIASANDEQIRNLRDFHPLRGVTDRWLYGEREFPLLPPGHRSAIFSLQSGSEKKYKGTLSLNFFYLNVGTEGHSWPVRIEIPSWVAEDKKKTDLLHCVLVEQCRIMGSRPYPYILHRAHETAVVRHEEKEQVAQLLALELRRSHEEIGDTSNKSSAKSLKVRTKHR